MGDKKLIEIDRKVALANPIPVIGFSSPAGGRYYVHLEEKEYRTTRARILNQNRRSGKDSPFKLTGIGKEPRGLIQLLLRDAREIKHKHKRK